MKRFYWIRRIKPGIIDVRLENSWQSMWIDSLEISLLWAVVTPVDAAKEPLA